MPSSSPKCAGADWREEGQDVRLRSPRGVLRPLDITAAADLHAMWTSAGVRRFLWDDRVISREDTGSAIARSGALFTEHGFGLWGFWSDDRQRLSGFGGLWPFRDPPVIELVYGVDETLWSRGYATEIARAVVDFSFAVLKMPVVRASTDFGNVASVRVLEKLSFIQTGRDTVAGLDTLFFERAASGLTPVRPPT
jgi:[ribosomal protein S5]-alanine N-acetyltransferase